MLLKLVRQYELLRALWTPVGANMQPHMLGHVDGVLVRPIAQPALVRGHRVHCPDVVQQNGFGVGLIRAPVAWELAVGVGAFGVALKAPQFAAWNSNLTDTIGKKFHFAGQAINRLAKTYSNAAAECRTQMRSHIPLEPVRMVHFAAWHSRSATR